MTKISLMAKPGSLIVTSKAVGLIGNLHAPLSVRSGPLVMTLFYLKDSIYIYMQMDMKQPFLFFTIFYAQPTHLFCFIK